MRKNNLFNILTIGLLFSGCATMIIPGQTQADSRLKADIIGMINMLESAQARGCSHKIVDTKMAGMDGVTVLEEWIVNSCGKDVVYNIKLTPDPKGGTIFGVQSPANR